MTTLAESPRRWWALAALVLSVLVITLDGTIINVALPVLSREIGADNTQLQWISGGYLLVFGAGMLPIGELGDRYGHKIFLLVGVLIFGVGSVAGLFVDSPAAVITCRVVLGAGAAMIMPLSMALLPRIFAPQDIQKAIGIWTAAAGLGLPIGPLVGGWLLEHFWWGSIFAFNIPVAVIAFVAGYLFLPGRDRAAANTSAPFDLLGAVLGIGGIVAVIYGTIEVPERGWGSPVVLATLVGGVLLLVAFVFRERSFSHPLVDLHLFAQRKFTWGSMTTVIVNFCLLGTLFVVPQYLQAVLGQSTFGTGLRLLPLIAGLMAAATLSESLVPRVGVRVVIPSGLVVFAAGLFLGTRTDLSSGYGFTALWLSVAGIGFGFAIVPATGLVLSTLPQNNAGAGSSLLETLQQVGSALGVALLGSVLTTSFVGRLNTDTLSPELRETARDSVTAADSVAAATHNPALLASSHEAFIHGLATVLTVAGIGALIFAALTAALLPSRSEDPAEAPAGEPAHQG